MIVLIPNCTRAFFCFNYEISAVDRATKNKVALVCLYRFLGNILQQNDYKFLYIIKSDILLLTLQDYNGGLLRLTSAGS